MPISASHTSHVPYVPSVEPGERLLDLLELLSQRFGERVVLADLGRHLAPIGEVAVEVELDLTAGGQLVDTTKECRALGVECLTELGVVVVGHTRRLVALVLGLVRPSRP